MPGRICYPACNEKRDFMEVKPPRTEADFYKQYDPMVGIGTAVALILFIFVITIRGCVKWAHRKFHMYYFNKARRKEEALKAALEEVATV